jgi:hypothetical protein
VTADQVKKKTSGRIDSRFQCPGLFFPLAASGARVDQTKYLCRSALCDTLYSLANKFFFEFEEMNSDRKPGEKKYETKGIYQEGRRGNGSSFRVVHV